mmetsp:Transcript_43284/g.114027  ORF Transcript_43284/g.114027 Transcript_43284/m.114027 type:complete len:1191 (-) Transcript_43284:29-3601(-)
MRAMHFFCRNNVFRRGEVAQVYYCLGLAAATGKSYFLRGSASGLGSQPFIGLVPASLTTRVAPRNAEAACAVAPIEAGQMTGVAFISIPRSAEVGQYEMRLFSSSDGAGDLGGSLACQVLPGVPDPPRAVHAEQVEENHAVVSWRAPDNGGRPITGYDLRLEGAVAEPAQLLSVEGWSTWCKLSGLQAFTGYRISVRAKSEIGSGEWSTPALFRTSPGLPGPPLNLRATNITVDTASLLWDPPRNNGGSVVTQYRVHGTVTSRSVASELPASGLDVTTDTPDPWLHLEECPAGATYRVIVAAVTAAGIGAASSEFVFRTLPGPPRTQCAPPVPVDVTSSSVVLEWQSPADVAPINFYRVAWTDHYADGDDVDCFIVDTDSTVPVLSVQDLECSSSYWFKVQAVNDFGSGPWSEFSRQVTTLKAPPSAPCVPIGHFISPGVVQLTWEVPSSDGGSPLTHYLVRKTVVGGPAPTGGDSVVASGLYRKTTDGSYTFAQGFVETAVLRDLDPYQSYIFSVRAVNSYGEGPWGPSTRVDPEENHLPGPPGQPVVLRNEDRQITLMWTAPSHVGTGGIVNYVLFHRPERSTESEWHEVPTRGSTPRLKVAVDCGVPYSFRVAAFSAAGRGPLGPELSGVHSAFAGPTPVTQLCAKMKRGFWDVSWSEPDDTGGCRISAYELETVDGGLETSSESIQVVANIGQMWIRVRAVSTYGTGEWAQIWVDWNGFVPRPVSASLENQTEAGAVVSWNSDSVAFHEVVVRRDDEEHVYCCLGEKWLVASVWGGLHDIAVRPVGHAGARPPLTFLEGVSLPAVSPEPSNFGSAKIGDDETQPSGDVAPSAPRPRPSEPGDVDTLPPPTPRGLFATTSALSSRSEDIAADFRSAIPARQGDGLAEPVTIHQKGHSAWEPVVAMATAAVTCDSFRHRGGRAEVVDCGVAAADGVWVRRGGRRLPGALSAADAGGNRGVSPPLAMTDQCWVADAEGESASAHSETPGRGGPPPLPVLRRDVTADAQGAGILDRGAKLWSAYPITPPRTREEDGARISAEVYLETPESPATGWIKDRGALQAEPSDLPPAAPPPIVMHVGPESQSFAAVNLVWEAAAGSVVGYRVLIFRLPLNVPCRVSQSPAWTDGESEAVLSFGVEDVTVPHARVVVEVQGSYIFQVQHVTHRGLEAPSSKSVVVAIDRWLSNVLQ